MRSPPRAATEEANANHGDNREELKMDFIERIFGISPDGGNGMFEFTLFALPVVILAILLYVRHQLRSRA
jgi:hypothetical protein